MDAVDVEAITKIVKMVGAEFKGASDEDIKFWICLLYTSDAADD